MRAHFLILSLAAILFSGLQPEVRAQIPSATNPVIRQLMSQPQIDIASPVVAVTSFEPPVVRTNEKAVYRVTLNALQTSIRWPDQIPLPAGLTARLTAQGQVYQPGNNTLRPLTTFVYDVRASRPGLFTVPAFLVEVYGRRVVIPETDLEALEEFSEPHEPARELVLECETTNAFVGQPLTVRVLSFGTPPNIVQGVSQLELIGDAFLENKNLVKRAITPVRRDGQVLPTFVYETTVTPLATGRQTLRVQGFSAGNDFGGPIVIQGSVTIPGGQPQHLLLDSGPVSVNVRPLPTEGRLPGFTGLIGKFTCDPPRLVTNAVRVGDPIQLDVTIRTEGDLSRIAPPPAPRVKDWQVFAGVSAGLVGGEGATSPGAVFRYTLIPLTDGAHATPAIPFCAFDPERAVYADLTIPPVAIKVSPSGLPTDYASTGWADETDIESKPALSGLAKSPGRVAGSFVPLQLRPWFPAVQIAPAFAFFGLWMWDRRRRYLEQHPEVVRRNLARRELRKQRRLLRRAANVRDTQAFTKAAVTAMKVASAPHFPANPHALVCGDVLSLFEPAARQGRQGETVRNFFTAADGARFSSQPGDAADALAWKSGLDDVLAQLEERL
jgi:hypothetical protein